MNNPHEGVTAQVKVPHLVSTVAQRPTSSSHNIALVGSITETSANHSPPLFFNQTGYARGGVNDLAAVTC